MGDQGGDEGEGEDYGEGRHPVSFFLSFLLVMGDLDMRRDCWEK